MQFNTITKKKNFRGACTLEMYILASDLAELESRKSCRRHSLQSDLTVGQEAQAANRPAWTASQNKTQKSPLELSMYNIEGKQYTFNKEL